MIPSRDLSEVLSAWQAEKGREHLARLSKISLKKVCYIQWRQVQESREKALRLPSSSVPPAFLALAWSPTKLLAPIGPVSTKTPFLIEPLLLSSGGHYPCTVLLIPGTGSQLNNTVATHTPLYGAKIETHRGLSLLLLQRWKNVGLPIFWNWRNK